MGASLLGSRWTLIFIMRCVVLLGLFLAVLAYEEKEAPDVKSKDMYKDSLKEDIEESHDDSPREEDLLEQVDEHAPSQPSFFNFPNFPPMMYPFFPPPWMNYFNPRPMPIMPPADPERYLKAMNEDDHGDQYEDDVLAAAAHHRANALARAEAHARAEALAHAEASEHKHRRRRSLYGGPHDELVDTFEVQHDDAFWQDIDGGEINPVSQKMSRGLGYQAKKAILKQMDHYAFPLHMGEIYTGRLPHPELSPPSDRAFGKGFDFNPEDLSSFRYQPKGGRFLDNEDFKKLYESGYQPQGKKYVLHKEAFTPETECRMLDKGIEHFRSHWKEVSCKEMYTPGVYRLVMADYHDEELYLFFREVAPGGKYWAVCDLNVMGLQAYSPLLEKYADKNPHHF